MALFVHFDIRFDERGNRAVQSQGQSADLRLPALEEADGIVIRALKQTAADRVAVVRGAVQQLAGEAR